MSSWRELRRFLERHGKYIRSGKHEVYMYRGKLIRVSHGSGEIDAGLWRKILKQELGITQDEFNAMI